MTRELIEKKQVEVALRELLQTSADIVQAIPVGLFIYQYQPPDQLLLVHSNPEAERLTGVTTPEWHGREFNEIWPQAREQGITQAFLAVIESGQMFETEALPYADNHQAGAFHIRAFSMPGQRLGVAFENVTKRKKVATTLQDNIHELKIAYQQAIIYAQELTREITERKQAERQIQKLNEELEQRVTDRTRDLSLLYEVTLVASESLAMEAMLERSLDRVLASIRHRAGIIHLLDEKAETLNLIVQQGVPADILAKIDAIPLHNKLARWMVEHNEPLLIPDITADARLPAKLASQGGRYAFLGVPMRAGGQMLGLLSLIGKRNQQFSVEEVALLASVADQVGVAVENTRLRQQAEHAAIIEERERLARELHDSVTQSLYSLTLFAEAGTELIDAKDFEAAKHNLLRMGETAQQALKEMRLMVYELRPLDLQREGLIGALHQRLSAVEGRVDIKARLVAEELVELPSPVEEGLYRIAQEALNNALKHAAATSVTVYLRVENEQVELEIVDDGKGFDPGAAPAAGGMGLVSMQERAKKLGGTLTILSTPHKGTRVKVNVKIPEGVQ
ncbi:MAG: GAF domain-containing sensor histidine kinase [Anaerolineae bacterium]|nr:GAF domain-containing sensor histidine kinase [Anaerolineae bacterium]